MGDLSGRVYVVTGGTQGLGEGVARELSACGAAGLAICGRNRARGDAVASELADTLFVEADLLREEDCRRVVAAACDRFGRIDGLVNAAGVTTRGNIDDTTVELWDEIFAVNVRAPFILMQEAIRAMKKRGRGGSIVNMLSMSSHGGQPFITAYCASKGALATLTKNVAHAVRADRIRVKGLNIGWMATPNEDAVQRAGGRPANWLEEADASQPFGRILRPADAAKLTAYLLSDAGEMVTGALIDVDQNVMGAYE